MARKPPEFLKDRLTLFPRSSRALRYFRRRLMPESLILTPKLPFIQSSPPWQPLGMTLAVMAVGVFLPMGPLAGYFKLEALALAYFG